MKCLGCYKEVAESYCAPCRNKLFEKSKIVSVLDFDAPKTDNLAVFQEHSRRLSISGVQLKYSLRLENKKLVLTDKNGQYILKPIPPSRHQVNGDDAPENEHLTMQIASQVFGINTAHNALILFKDGQPAYITKRFDVKTDGSKYQQEDFAQILNRSKYSHGATFKYDATYEEIGLAIKKYVAASMPALENFFRLLVFNYVISNGDAHLKNFSLIRTETSEYQLSPAYDLLSTIIHTPSESDTALDLFKGSLYAGHHGTYGHYGRTDFLELSGRLGIIPKRAERIIDHFSSKHDSMKKLIDTSFLSPPVKQIFSDNLADKLKRIS